MPTATIDELFEDAKARAQRAPTDFRARSDLWQIFAARGEVDRARKQLDLMIQIDSSWAMEVQACHGLLLAEDERLKIFAGVKPPVCLGTPPDWFAKSVVAVGMVAAGHAEAAAKLLSEVRDEAQALCGTLNQGPFEWLCDGDARIGPYLEVIVQGRYFWAPWQSLRSLVTRPPTEIRDMLWQQAMVEVTEEGPIEAFIPVRYPHPRNSDESLSRRTDWEPLSTDLYIGYGQKTLFTNDNSCGYLDVRKLDFTAQGAV